MMTTTSWDRGLKSPAGLQWIVMTARIIHRKFKCRPPHAGMAGIVRDGSLLRSRRACCALTPLRVTKDLAVPTLAALAPRAAGSWAARDALGPQTNGKRPLTLEDIGSRLRRSGAVFRHLDGGHHPRVTRCRSRARTRGGAGAAGPGGSRWCACSRSRSRSGQG
jgi:hypothetical protein